MYECPVYPIVLLFWLINGYCLFLFVLFSYPNDSLPETCDMIPICTDLHRLVTYQYLITESAPGGRTLA